MTSLASLLKPGGVFFSPVKRGAGEVVGHTGRWFSLYNEARWASHLRKAGFEITKITSEAPVGGSAAGRVGANWFSSLARLP